MTGLIDPEFTLARWAKSFMYNLFVFLVSFSAHFEGMSGYIAPLKFKPRNFNLVHSS